MDERSREIPLGAVEEKKRRSPLAEFFVRLVKEKPLGTAGGIIVLIVAFGAAFADLAWLGLPGIGLAPYGFNEIMLLNRLEGPSAAHILGVDHLGRDTFSRILMGARISFAVGLAGALVDVIVAMFIGIISGYAGGKTDIAIQRFVDAWQCFPPMFIYLTIMAVLGPGLGQVILVLGVARGIRESRIVRSAVIGIKENIYLDAARAIGATNGRILARHILPNVAAPIIVLFTVSTGFMILTEATLSFLGFGIPPPFPSWGGMLSGAGRKYMLISPWMVLWPGLALATLVYGLNMLGDAVRDLLDPRLRGGLGRFSGVAKKRARVAARAGEVSVTGG